ncbi:MAG: hypothetical protein LBT55_01770 [Clostridiaceae bacterium]|jgi:hypothetical protein|nr:hypothetical protein [Clostridiaceae bacterium]
MQKINGKLEATSAKIDEDLNVGGTVSIDGTLSCNISNATVLWAGNALPPEQVGSNIQSGTSLSDICSMIQSKFKPAYNAPVTNVERGVHFFPENLEVPQYFINTGKSFNGNTGGINGTYLLLRRVCGLNVPEIEYSYYRKTNGNGVETITTGSGELLNGTYQIKLFENIPCIVTIISTSARDFTIRGIGSNFEELWTVKITENIAEDNLLMAQVGCLISYNFSWEVL